MLGGEERRDKKRNRKQLKRNKIIVCVKETQGKLTKKKNKGKDRDKNKRNRHTNGKRHIKIVCHM